MCGSARSDSVIDASTLLGRATAPVVIATCRSIIVAADADGTTVVAPSSRVAWFGLTLLYLLILAVHGTVQSQGLLSSSFIAGTGIGGWLSILEDEYVESAVLLSFLMLDFEVEFLDEFFPVAIGEVAATHEVVAPLGVLVVVELDDVGQSLVHKHHLPATPTHPQLPYSYLRISYNAL